jgi:hypothetical protein
MEILFNRAELSLVEVRAEILESTVVEITFCAAKDSAMHDIDWKWCPHVAAHEITRTFLISKARLQKARQRLEAYGRDLDDLLEAFADLPFTKIIEADCGLLELYIDGLCYRPPKHGSTLQSQNTHITNTRLSLATIRRRDGTARCFYQCLIDRRLRTDLVNPMPKGEKERAEALSLPLAKTHGYPMTKSGHAFSNTFLSMNRCATRSCSWSATMGL